MNAVLYELVKNNGTHVGYTNACKAVGVSPSGYATWKFRPPPETDTRLVKAIHEVAKSPRYGYRRVTVELRDEFGVNHKRVLNIMRFEGLTIKKKAFKPRTTNSNHDFKKYPNLVKDVHESGLNQVWVGDITYIWIGEKFAYLATLLDRYSRKCLGWGHSEEPWRQAFPCAR